MRSERNPSFVARWHRQGIFDTHLLSMGFTPFFHQRRRPSNYPGTSFSQSPPSSSRTFCGCCLFNFQTPTRPRTAILPTPINYWLSPSTQFSDTDLPATKTTRSCSLLGFQTPTASKLAHHSKHLCQSSSSLRLHQLLRSKAKLSCSTELPPSCSSFMNLPASETKMHLLERACLWLSFIESAAILERGTSITLHYNLYYL